VAGTLLGAASALAACDGSYDQPADRHWPSAHFDYLTRAADDTTCPDILGPLEQHFAELQGYLGFEWPDGRKVTYEKFVDQADYQAHAGCPAGAGACTEESTVETSSGLELHELVHAYLWPTGYPPPVLVEGVAVVLSCTSALYGYSYVKPSEDWTALPSLSFTTADPDDVYVAGAWLVGYLLDEFGPQPFMTIYHTLRVGDDAATMDAAFRSTYGQSLAALWAAALADSHPRNVCIWQCSRPPIVLDGTPIDAAGVCGAGDVFHPFTLASASTVGFSVTEALVGLGACGQVPVTPGAFSGAGAVPALSIYALPAGSYFLDYEEVSGAEGTVAGTADFSPPLAPTCAAANAAAVDAADVTLTIPSSQPNWFWPLPPPPSPGQMLSVFPPFDVPATAAICASCDPTSCVDASQAVPWASGQMLNFETNSSEPFNRFILNWSY
jgi:hypothetical protein